MDPPFDADIEDHRYIAGEQGPGDAEQDRHDESPRIAAPA